MLFELLGHLRRSFWVAVLGAIVLYGFFTFMASISPSEIAGVTTVIGAMTVAVTVRNVRLASELADRGGSPHLRRTLNRLRERRGF